jgi:hypothetical protein
MIRVKEFSFSTCSTLTNIFPKCALNSSVESEKSPSVTKTSDVCDGSRPERVSKVETSGLKQVPSPIWTAAKLIGIAPLISLASPAKQMMAAAHVISF